MTMPEATDTDGVEADISATKTTSVLGSKRVRGGVSVDVAFLGNRGQHDG